MKTLAAVLMTSLLAAVLAGCSGAPSTDQSTTAQSASGTSAPETVNPADAVVTDENGTHVTLQVTKEGFVPAEFHVPAGNLVTLSVTRKVEKTCATEIVMKDFGIEQELPLNTTVQVSFRPTEPGEHRFACGMDMIAGKVIVD